MSKRDTIKGLIALGTGIVGVTLAIIAMVWKNTEAFYSGVLLIIASILLVPERDTKQLTSESNDYDKGFKAGYKHAQDTVNEWYYGEDKECEH